MYINLKHTLPTLASIFIALKPLPYRCVSQPQQKKLADIINNAFLLIFREAFKFKHQFSADNY